MPVPGFQHLMLPALRVLADGRDHTPAEVIEAMANEFKLTDAERKEMLPSGRITVIGSRTHWAVTYMHHAGLLDKPRRAVWVISDEGGHLLRGAPTSIGLADLRRSPAFVAWHKSSRATGGPSVRLAGEEDTSGESPEESLARIWASITAQVADELMGAIRRGSPTFFERLVVELLVAMGYGGSYAEAAQVTRASGDGGIDGIIKEDRLGLDTIYVQAKRWEATVGRPDIQKFAGSLEGERARKGIFITSSNFSPDARDYVKRIDKRIILIDGPTLTGLMIEHGVGVTKDHEYVIPKVDADYFDDA